MNKKLVYSSVIIGIIIVLISIHSYNEILLPLYAITYVGIITSIVNHSTTNNLAKYIDRFIMGLIAIVYIYYGLYICDTTWCKIITLSIIFIMIMTYFSSKFIANKIISTNIHLITHLLSLVLFLFMIYIFYYDSGS